MKKFLAIVLSLIMAFSVAVLPASAVTVDAGAVDQAQSAIGTVTSDAQKAIASAKVFYEKFTAKDLEGTINAAIVLAKDLATAIHSLVHTLSQLFDFNCPFCNGNVKVETEETEEAETTSVVLEEELEAPAVA